MTLHIRLLLLLNQLTGFGEMYDFLYLPHSCRTRGNLGYAFINFSSASGASPYSTVACIPTQPGRVPQASVLVCNSVVFAATYHK